MIIMGNFSDPYTNICIVNGEVKIMNLKDYNAVSNHGVADQIDDKTIIGIFCYNNMLYLSINNKIFDISLNKITCSNNIVNDKRFFELKSGNNIVYSKEYDVVCSYDDLLMGEIEEEQDFLLYLSNLLSSQQNINNFLQGFVLKK